MKLPGDDNCIGKNIVQSKLNALIENDKKIQEMSEPLAKEWFDKLERDLCCVKIPKDGLRWSWKFPFLKKCITYDNTSVNFYTNYYYDANEKLITVTIYNVGEGYYDSKKRRTYTRKGVMMLDSECDNLDKPIKYEEFIDIIASDVAEYINNFNRKHEK